MVEYTKGIVTVPKLNVVLVAFDENPAVMIFVVVMAFDTYRFPVILADAFERVRVFANTLVVVKEFETATFVRRPTEVMFGWAAWETTRATFAFATFPNKFDEFMFEIPDPLETMSKPWTFRPVKVPTDVILGWAAWDTTRATLAFATFPKRFDEFMFEIPDPLEATSNPWIVRPDRIPTEVILGWAAWDTTRATLALATLPMRFEELRAYRAVPFE